MDARLLGVDTVSAVPELARAASPVTHAKNAAGPLLLKRGTQTASSTPREALGYSLKALREASRYSQPLLVAGTDHQDEASHGPAALGDVAGVSPRADVGSSLKRRPKISRGELRKGV